MGRGADLDRAWDRVRGTRPEAGSARRMPTWGLPTRPAGSARCLPTHKTRVIQDGGHAVEETVLLALEGAQHLAYGGQLGAQQQLLVRRVHRSLARAQPPPAPAARQLLPAECLGSCLAEGDPGSVWLSQRGSLLHFGEQTCRHHVFGCGIHPDILQSGFEMACKPEAAHLGAASEPPKSCPDCCRPPLVTGACSPEGAQGEVATLCQSRCN